MRIDDPRIDWTAAPDDAVRSAAPDAFHDGVAVIVSDARERTTDISISMPHLARYGAAPPDVSFGVRISDVSTMRASVIIRYPVPFMDVEGETKQARSARLEHWFALAQEVSIDWSDFETAVRSGGMMVGRGAALRIRSPGVAALIV